MLNAPTLKYYSLTKKIKESMKEIKRDYVVVYMSGATERVTCEYLHEALEMISGDKRAVISIFKIQTH